MPEGCFDMENNGSATIIEEQNENNLNIDESQTVEVSKNNIPPQTSVPMSQPQVASSKPSIKIPKELLQFESVSRIGAIPLVESGIEIGGLIYNRVKESNRLTNWYLTRAEASLLASLNLAVPAVTLFKNPLSRIDQFLCKSLDIVETSVPSITLPPQMIYSNAQDYMNVHIVKPVMKRADSVKVLGTAVLDSRVTCIAADQIDHILDKVDVYVDKYLPPDAQDSSDVVDSPNKEEKVIENNIDANNTGRQKAAHTIQHANRFSRKLQKRLTMRTIQEAKALKEHTTEAIHVLVYIAELIATDPKLALQKAKELWADLSKDEPENQAPPATLEQLIVMITRESARRLVHLVNFTTGELSKLPRSTVTNIRNATQQFLEIADSMIKKVHLESAKQRIVNEAKYYRYRLEVFISELQQHSKVILENLAMLIAGNSKSELIKTGRACLHNNHTNYTNSSINGVN